MSDNLLKDLVRDASRANIAESDLADLKSRITTFNVRIEPDYLDCPLPDDAKLLDACNSIARLLANTPGSIRTRTDADGATTYTITVIRDRVP